MTLGRRRLVLMLCFLGLSLALTMVKVQAQPPLRPGMPKAPPSPESPAHPWEKPLSAQELKDALSRFGDFLGESDSNELQKALQESFSKQYPNYDPEFLNGLMKNKDFVDKVQRMAKDKSFGQGEKPKFSEQEITELMKSLPKDKLPSSFSPQPPKNTDSKDDQHPPRPNQGKMPNQPLPPPMLPGASKGPQPSIFKQNNNGTQTTEPSGKNSDHRLPDNNPISPDIAHEKFHPPEINPFGLPDDSNDPRSKSMSALASLWERNIGPLDDTPEVKRALFDLVSGENGFDFDIKDEHGNSFWDTLKNDSGDNTSFSDFLKDSSNGGGDPWNWTNNLPTVGWGKWFSGSSSSPDWRQGSSSPRTPQMPDVSSSGWSFGGGGMGGISGSWFTVLLLVLVVLAALFLWWYLRENPSPEGGLSAGGTGSWPIDPHSIKTREDVVKAFEYISVRICGSAAKMWTHSTIAQALTELAVTQGEVAVKLARLYELARYAPLDEPLTTLEVIEARHIVCDLAEVV